MNELRLTLPWPPKELSPNARQHYMALHRAKRSYKLTCATVVRSQGGSRLDAGALDVRFVFYPPTRRRIDLDNCIARMKAGIDALAMVFGVDDSRWRMGFEMAGEIGSKVVVIVKEAA